MRAVAIAAFVTGLVLGVRVMFFGVQRRRGTEYLFSRVWPLALALFLLIAGAGIYSRAALHGNVGMAWSVGIVVLSLALSGFAWRSVRRSAVAPSTDPEDDPRYRFQGHIARIVQSIGIGPTQADGRVTFEFDGKRHEYPARWTREAQDRGTFAGVNEDVVIERVEDDVALVEPWSVVEQRL
jgi:hypothetical protein